MNIHEALERLSAFIDMVVDSGFLCEDGELETIEKVEGVINAYVCEKESV